MKGTRPLANDETCYRRKMSIAMGHYDNGRDTMRHQAIKIELKSTTRLFASFIFITLVSSIGVAQVDTWTRKADMPTARGGLSASVVDGKIYAIGGEAGSQVFSTVEAYDPATDTWTRKADMPTPRGFFFTAVVNDKIYAIGGAGGNPLSAVELVEVYDPATDTWIKKAEMPTARSDFSGSVADGKIYAMGGFDGDRRLSTVEAYDPVTDTWIRKADMPTPRCCLSTSTVNGKIYAIGGAAGGHRSTVEAYDPATDTWTKKADMPTARSNFSTSVVNGKIYAIGGNATGPATFPTVEVYDPLEDTWTTKTDMPTARDFLSTSAVNGYIYAIGGALFFRGPVLSVVEAYDTSVGISVQIISPQEGSVTGGEPIAMSGTGFSPDVIVTIDGNPLTNLEVINGTVLSGITPPGTAGETTIQIIVPGLKYPLFAGGFLYPSPVPPTITAITPNRGPLTGGQIATIVGNGFIPGVSVVIGDVEANVTAFTETHITFTTPPHTEGAKFVVVRNVDRKVGFLDGGYTYLDVEFPPEDLNLDGVVDLFDLVHVASQFGLEGDHTGDVNGDGTVDLFDLVRVASHFGETAVGAAPPGVDWALNQSVSSPERVHHALAELEAMTEIPHGVVVAIEFLRAWLTNVNPPVTETKLLPNYPNPFNPETWIPYQLATDADVQVRIYDISGRAIRQLIIGHQQAGYYVSREHAVYWNGRDENGESVSSGLYFYQLRAGDYSAVKRMVIVK